MLLLTFPSQFRNSIALSLGVLCLLELVLNPFSWDSHLYISTFSHPSIKIVILCPYSLSVSLMFIDGSIMWDELGDIQNHV